MYTQNSENSEYIKKTTIKEKKNGSNLIRQIERMKKRQKTTNNRKLAAHKDRRQLQQNSIKNRSRLAVCVPQTFQFCMLNVHIFFHTK